MSVGVLGKVTYQLLGLRLLLLTVAVLRQQLQRPLSRRPVPAVGHLRWLILVGVLQSASPTVVGHSLQRVLCRLQGGICRLRLEYGEIFIRQQRVGWCLLVQGYRCVVSCVIRLPSCSRRRRVIHSRVSFCREQVVCAVCCSQLGGWVAVFRRSC